jgi:hypothetical protein
MDSIIHNKYIIFSIILAIIVGLYYIQYKYGHIIISKDLYDIPFNIERTKKETPTVVAGVPLVIYQTWHSNKVPEKMKENIYKLLEVNPEFDYFLYSDEKCREFIENNFPKEVVNAFDMLIPGAYKSDLWRYCVLYKLGGVYLDIKYYSVMPMIDIIHTNPIIFVKDAGELTCGNGKYTGLYNAFMASTPQNPIFKGCIDDIVNSCKFKLYKNGSLDITGPCLLGRILIETNGYEYFKNIQFKHVFGAFMPIQILYKNSVILQGYPEYRGEQKMFQKTEHSSALWNQRRVYKGESIFQ